MSFHPEMRGKFWITIIRNHSFHKSLIHSIGCSLLFWTAVTVSSSVFCSINTYLYRFNQAPKILQKNTKNDLLSCHSCNTCVIRTVLNAHRFCLINVLHRFVGTEHSPAHVLSPASKECVKLLFKYLISDKCF